MEPLIRSTSLRGFIPLVTELGGDPYDYLDRFGISRLLVERSTGLVPITAHDRMLDAAATELDCPDFGLCLAEHQDVGILGPIASAVVSASNALEALDNATRFMFVHSPVIVIEAKPDPRGREAVIALVYRKDLVRHAYSPQAMELGLGLFHRVGRALLGSDLGFRSVEISHAPISPVSRYLEFFGRDVRFDRPESALRVDRRILETAFVTADENVHSRAVARLSEEQERTAPTIEHKVAAAISEHLDRGEPALDDIAGRMMLHPRTLQRRLAAEGASFGVILDGVRRDIAFEYVTGTDMPLGQVAALVGFAEQSALSRAMKRWFGRSPRALRAEQREPRV